MERKSKKHTPDTDGRMTRIKMSRFEKVFAIVCVLLFLIVLVRQIGGAL